jgi:hypothetical protein
MSSEMWTSIVASDAAWAQGRNAGWSRVCASRVWTPEDRANSIHSDHRCGGGVAACGDAGAAHAAGWRQAACVTLNVHLRCNCCCSSGLFRKRSILNAAALMRCAAPSVGPCPVHTAGGTAQVLSLHTAGGWTVPLCNPKPLLMGHIRHLASRPCALPRCGATGRSHWHLCCTRLISFGPTGLGEIQEEKTPANVLRSNRRHRHSTAA